MHSQRVTEIKFDDNFIVTASDDNSAACWDVTNGTRLISYVGHKGPVVCVDFNTRINILVTGSTDSKVKIWSFTEGNLLLTLKFDLSTTYYGSNFVKVKIWGDCLLQPLFSYHILATSDEYEVVDFEIQWNTTTVLKKKYISWGQEHDLIYSGFHVVGSSLKIWGMGYVKSMDITTLTEFSFDSVDDCGQKSFRMTINRVIRIPTTCYELIYLGSGVSFDAFLQCIDGSHWQLFVSRNNSETDHFVIDLPDR